MTRLRWRPLRGLLIAAGLLWVPGCLLEQDLGSDVHDDLAALPADLTVAAVIDLRSPPDLALPDLALLPDLLHSPPDIACPLEQTFCDNTCRNLNSDPAHCGACATACTLAQICVKGVCDGCPVNQVRCENHCALLSSDGNNCGKCGNVCPVGKTCVAGGCV